MFDKDGKCSNCGLVNFSNEPYCRRCGNSLNSASYKNSTNKYQPTLSMLLFALLFVGCLAVAIYFFKQQSFSSEKPIPQTNKQGKSSVSESKSTTTNNENRSSEQKQTELPQRPRTLPDDIREQLNNQTKEREKAIKKAMGEFENGSGNK